MQINSAQQGFVWPIPVTQELRKFYPHVPISTSQVSTCLLMPLSDRLNESLFWLAENPAQSLQRNFTTWWRNWFLSTNFLTR